MTATKNIATTTVATSKIATSATLCSDKRTTNNSSNTACAVGDSGSDGNTVSSKTRGEHRESSKGNFATQTEVVLIEERGVQVQSEEEFTNEKKEEVERSELARLRISLIEAKVA